MKHQRLATVISLARLMAISDMRLAAEYLRDQGLSAHLAVHILERAVRLSVLILKNAESADLVRHFICDRLIILIRYTEKDQESLSDGTGLPPVHMYRRMFYSL